MNIKESIHLCALYSEGLRYKFFKPHTTTLYAIDTYTGDYFYKPARDILLHTCPSLTLKFAFISVKARNLFFFQFIYLNVM